MTLTISDTQPPRRPILRYFGGKWQIAPWIVRQLPAHQKYIEPFGGGGSVLLMKPVVHAEVYNDLDGEIVNLFRVLRDQQELLVEKITLTPFAREEFDLSYTPCTDPVEQARRTLVRSWMGFASQATSGRRSGFRNETAREYSLPVHDWASLSPTLSRIAKRLRRVIIENRDAIKVMTQHDNATALHYVDPPYLSTTRSNEYKNVYRHEMSDAQHIDLIDCIKSLKGMVVLSGYRNELYSNALAEWTMTTCVNKAGGQPGGRDLNREEVMWRNPACIRAIESKEPQMGLDFQN